MSWRKAALFARVTWIGWSFDFEAFTVELDPSKLRRLLDLLKLLSASPRCTVSALEKLTGKLLPLAAIPVASCSVLRIPPSLASRTSPSTFHLAVSGSRWPIPSVRRGALT